jgi:hypothetical protein
MTDQSNTNGKPIGYMLATRGLKPSDPYVADWDGEVHPTLESAWEQCKSANGEEWAADIEKYGPRKDNLSVLGYLPYALTLAVPAEGTDHEVES